MKSYNVPHHPIVSSSEAEEPMRLIRYTYFVFVFSITFDAADIGIGSWISTFSRLVGYMFVMITLLQPSICFRHPPKAFWYFVGYLYMLILMIFWHGFETEQLAVPRLFTLSQLLVLFWLSYNLMQYEHIRTGTLLMLAMSCTFLASLMTLNIVTISADDAPLMTTSTGAVVSEVYHGRLTAFGANPNTISAILSLGLLALVGLAFGPEKRDVKLRLLAWPCLGIFAIAIVRTGSRGAVVAIMAGLLIFLMKGKGNNPRIKLWLKRSRLKIGLAAVGVVGFIIIFSLQYEPIRARWEQTLVEGRTSGREKILTEAFGMFLEKPLLGWGPVTQTFELGARLGIRERDPHNSYLYVLLETGIVGAVPFFAGLWLCWKKAWKAQGGSHSILSAGLLVAIFISALKGTNHKSKLFWIVLAYALANGTVAALPRTHFKTLRKVRRAQARWKNPA